MQSVSVFMYVRITEAVYLHACLPVCMYGWMWCLLQNVTIAFIAVVYITQADDCALIAQFVQQSVAFVLDLVLKCVAEKV